MIHLNSPSVRQFFFFLSIFGPQIKASLQLVPRRMDTYFPSGFLKSGCIVSLSASGSAVNLPPLLAAWRGEGQHLPTSLPDRCSRQPDELRGPGASVVAAGCLSREVVGQGLAAPPPWPFITAADGAPIFCRRLPLGLLLIHQNDKWQEKERGGVRAGLSKRAQCPVG